MEMEFIVHLHYASCLNTGFITSLIPKRARKVTGPISVLPLSKATFIQQSEGALVAVVAKR